MGFLTDGEEEWGFVLTLMKANKETQGKYPGSFHIGFFIDSEETVDEIYRRLKKEGFGVPPPERNNHAYGFYVEARAGSPSSLVPNLVPCKVSIRPAATKLAGRMILLL